MAFVEITDSAALPAPGAGRELLHIDFKTLPANSRFEMAKDIAAFANADGGTLLIGAVEDSGTRVLSSYRPLAQAAAARAEHDYSEAVRDLCIPKPLLTFEHIGVAPGVVLAVNVWPSVAHPIAVRVRADKAHGFGGDAYYFPLRVTTHTIELDPEQVSMLTVPTIRRMSVLLSRIRPGSVVRLQFRRPRHEGAVDSQFLFVGVDPLQNRIELALPTQSSTTFHLPIDAVESAWSDILGWTLAASGGIDQRNGIVRWVLYES